LGLDRIVWLDDHRLVAVTTDFDRLHPRYAVTLFDVATGKP